MGWGTGQAIARKFAAQDYRVAMIARNTDRLLQFEKQIPNSHSYPCDVTDEKMLASTIKKITQDVGPPNVVIHNAVGGTWGNFLEIDPADLEYNFRVNALAFLHLARLTAPAMITRGAGVIICTGNTAAHRGKSEYAAFAPAKAAQRIVAESIAREVGPKGVHVAYVTIDATIDLRWTRRRHPTKSDDYFIKPSEIADEVFHVSQQPKSAWSFNVEIRPHGEIW